MRAAPQFVVLVILLLLVAAMSLWPRRAEQIAVLADEGRHEEAIALIEGRLAEQPRDPGLLAALGRSRAALGQYRQALEAIDAYLTMRPGDLAARERQVFRDKLIEGVMDEGGVIGLGFFGARVDHPVGRPEADP